MICLFGIYRTGQKPTTSSSVTIQFLNGCTPVTCLLTVAYTVIAFDRTKFGRLQQKLFHFFPVFALIQKMVVISMELAYLQYSKGTKYCNPKQGEKDIKLKNSFHVLFTSYI